MANINKITQYFKDSKNEFKKVTWPTKKEIRQHTLLVISISLAIAAFLGLVDYILTQTLEKII